MSITSLAPDEVVENPKNPRRLHDDAKQKELNADVLAKGILQPLLVRPRNGGYELVCGHRRWRAANAAKLREVPVLVRELDDRAALEAAISENGQRADISPIEEGEAFRRLREDHRATVPEIAAKVGKSEAYVHKRLKFTELPAKAQEALQDGRLALSVAEAILRIPDPKQQAKAAVEVLREHELWVGGELVRLRMQPFQAFAVIRNEFMLRLDSAPFDPADPSLVTKAGACSACPKNTAQQKALFGEFGKGALCTDAACFEKKKAATWRRRVAAADDDGTPILEGAEAKKHLDFRGTTVVGDKYVELDGKAGRDEDAQNRPWRQILGRAASETVKPVAVLRDPAGGVHDLYDRKALVALAMQTGRLKAPEAERFSDPQEPWRKKQKEEAEHRKAAKVVAGALEKEIFVGLDDGRIDDAMFWRIFVTALVRNGEATVVAANFGLTKHDPSWEQARAAIRTHSVTAPVAELRKIALALALGDGVFASHQGAFTDLAQELAKTLAIDLKASMRDVKKKKPAPKKGRGSPSPTASDA